MSTKEIHFKKNFSKLHNQTQALLIRIIEKKGTDLCQDFIEYDTDNQYPIDKNQYYLVLYFIGNKLIPFTSIRKYNDENLLKYVFGAEFNIIIDGAKND